MSPTSNLKPERPSHMGLECPDAEQALSAWIRGLRWLDTGSPTLICAVGVMMILSIGALSYLTGPQLSSSLLYLIPVLLITRVTGFYPGMCAALLAASIWLSADLNTGLEFGHPITPYWNALMRLGTFLVAVGLVSATKSLNAHLEERVQERTAALEAQIAETRDLEKTILEISDRERAAIGQDLHDGLCQQLVGAAFSANLLCDKLAKVPSGESTDANRIADMIDDAITQARNLARGLYPVRLETEGLELALQELASTLSQRFNIPCTVECPGSLPPCSANTGIQLYRIAQEAVTNAAKHASPHQILIHLSGNSPHLLLKIADDGIGFKPTGGTSGGMGLSIMAYRARMIGADFRVNRLSTGGTEVVCELEIYNLKPPPGEKRDAFTSFSENT